MNSMASEMNFQDVKAAGSSEVKVQAFICVQTCCLAWRGLKLILVREGAKGRTRVGRCGRCRCECWAESDGGGKLEKEDYGKEAFDAECSRVVCKCKEPLAFESQFLD